MPITRSWPVRWRVTSITGPGGLRRLTQLRRDGLEYSHVGVEKTKPASRIAPVGGAARVLVDVGGEDDKACPVEVVITVPDRDQGGERQPKEFFHA